MFGAGYDINSSNIIFLSLFFALIIISEFIQYFNLFFPIGIMSRTSKSRLVWVHSHKLISMFCFWLGLFGIKAFSNKVPHRHAKENEDVMYRVFLNKCDSVKEYYRLLNTHEAYYKFRKYRNYALMNDKPINPKVAIQTMDRYSETPDYADRVIEIIRDLERL